MASCRNANPAFLGRGGEKNYDVIYYEINSDNYVYQKSVNKIISQIDQKCV